MTDAGPWIYYKLTYEPLAFRSQAAIVSENSTVFTFSHKKAKVTKFDLVVK